MPIDVFDNVAKNMADMLSAAHRCLDEREILPCLTLLYAGMDVMASLEAAPGEKGNVYFKRWVETYLLPLTSWKCSAADIYGARCAVVHTFTPDSDLSNRGAAKVIYYAHSGANVAELEQINIDFNRDAACLDVIELLVSFRIAIRNQLVEVRRDPLRKAGVETKAGLWFADTDAALINEYLDAKAARNS